MFDDVHRFVTTCVSCQTNKPHNRAPAGQAQPIEVTELPFLEVALDFTGPLPTSKRGNNTMLNVTDYASRTIRCIPCSSTQQNPIAAEETAQLYFDQIFRYHGLPMRVRSDSGSQFVSTFLTELWRLCGTKQTLSTAYHPQSQGLVEHANRTLIESLRHYLHGVYEDWEDHVPAVEFAYNHSVHPTLCISPFEYLYGFNPRTPLTLNIQQTASEASKFMQKLVSRIRSAHDHFRNAQLKQAELLDRRRVQADLRVGDYALLSTKDLSLSAPTKFTPRYLGPFKVRAVKAHGNAVELELPATLPIEPVISTNRLRKFKPLDPQHGPSSVAQPPPVLVDNDGEYYEIERIVAERTIRMRGRNVIQYELKWRDYDPSWNTWVTHNFLATEPGGPEAISHWRRRQLSIPVPPTQDRGARHRGRMTAAARRAQGAGGAPALAPALASVPLASFQPLMSPLKEGAPAPVPLAPLPASVSCSRYPHRIPTARTTRQGSRLRAWPPCSAIGGACGVVAAGACSRRAGNPTLRRLVVMPSYYELSQ